MSLSSVELEDGTMIVAAETCDCVGPMIDSGWLMFLGAIAVVGPALLATTVRHRRRRRPELPADDPLLASSGQSGGEAWPDLQSGPDRRAGRNTRTAPTAIAATEAPPPDVG